MSAELTFRPLRESDTARCLAIFDANCPEFFAANERDDYRAYLSARPGGYEVCTRVDTVVGAYGLGPDAAQTMRLSWILIHPAEQGHGVGLRIMQRVLCGFDESDARRLHIAASHRSAPFFARFGARTVTTTPDGWGVGMHRVDMLLEKPAPCRTVQR